MKRLILIFIFVSGINLFAQANFSLYIYKGKANYLKGYNQYLPSVYYIFNYILNINNYLIEKEYIYNYTNKKMYLLKDYYSYYYGSLYNPKRDLVLKYYDLNGKQRTNDYEFTIRTVKGTNRYGDEIIEDNYYDYTGKYINNDYLKIFSSWSIQSYENSLKLPNVINPKNIGLYDIWGGLLALGSEYQIYDDDSREYNGYDYSGKDYIFGINIYNDSIYTNYYIIDLETKSKINYKNVINKEEYEKRLKEYENKLKEREEKITELEAEISKNMDSLESLRKYKDDFIREETAFYMRNGYSKEEAEAMAEKVWKNSGNTAHQYSKLNGLEYKLEKNKKEIEELKNELEELKNELEELKNELEELKNELEELKNIKKDMEKNEYIKYFREKFPELENDFYYLGENSITTNSINFIPFKYLKPYFERDNIKTKEQFYKLINFENEK